MAPLRLHVPLMSFLSLLALALPALAGWEYNGVDYPDVPDYGPQPPPPYMVDNLYNTHHAAPDKGKQNGPVWAYSGSLANYLSNLENGHVIRGGWENDTRTPLEVYLPGDPTVKRQSSGSSYWLPALASLGAQPLAPANYKFYRNVVTDYKADNTGATDATEALNAAVSDGNRCGEECGNDFTEGAIIYFPPGTYKICTPVIQLYYTQFIGDALNPPTIQGCSNFSGIALIDTDPYIPGGNGDEWYVNQNQFFRQIRNFVFDLTKMPQSTDDDGQPLVPTGIHWQVAQATSLQNLVFNMPQDTSSNATTAVGIFTENGSGGFVSDLTFNGGSIGWRAGSQQYTARNLQFTNCLTAVQMIWDWGFTWQNIQISGGSIAFNLTGHGGVNSQGIGSASIIDTTISNVPIGVLTDNSPISPNIVLDNVVVNNVPNVVQVDGGKTLLTASGTIDLWTTGQVFNGSTSSQVTGTYQTPPKAPGLLASGNRLFVQSRPQYENYGVSSFMIATTDGGCSNMGVGDQSNCLNVFLQKAVAAQKIAYFPAGIYQVGSTVFIPTGSRVQGSSWSQIMGSGYYFSDMLNPKVVVQVGNIGDVGTMEIVEMLFTVKGNTAGAIILEWNIAAETQGSAALWDSHIRVGGANGTDLTVADCPKFGYNDQCIAASLMFHVTPQASGYFENMWAWVADHDNDDNVFDNFDPLSDQISVYGARGMLIESQGPSWFYGTSSEHSTFYNYQLSGAKNIYMGFIQTETPYYQPDPVAPAPFNVSASFPNDPDFSQCDGDTACAASWGLRIVDSSSVTIHGAGHYSFFQNYYQDCLSTYNCQEKMVQVTGSTGVVIYNLITIGTVDIANGIDGTVLYQNQSQRGFTTEDAIWLPLPGDDDISTIYVGTPIFSTSTVSCNEPSCLFVFPTSPLPTPATIEVGPYTTSFEYGGFSTITQAGQTTVTFETTTTTTVLSVPPVTISGMSYSNYNVTSGMTPTITVSPSVDLPPVTISLPNGSGGTTTRVIPLPPWPAVESAPGTFSAPSGPQSTNTYYTGITSSVTVTGPTVETITFPSTLAPSYVTCPPNSYFTFNTPAVTVELDCSALTTYTIDFLCPTTTVVSFLDSTVAPISVDCSFSTQYSVPPPPSTTSTTTTPLPVWTTWPPGTIIPITTSVDGPEPTQGGTKEPCTLWFFFICISHKIGGFYWSFPPGIYPPGPPPIPEIEFPPGFTLHGSLPPWPQITIGPNGGLTYSEEPTSCQTETASICSTTTIYQVTSSGSSVKTTATQTSSDCETISGCSVSYSNFHTQTTSVVACSPSPSPGAEKRELKNKMQAREAFHEFEKRAPECQNLGAIVYPANPMSVGNIPTLLNGLTYTQIQSTYSGYTAYFWVEAVEPALMQQLQNDPSVEIAYYYYEFNQNNQNSGGAMNAFGSAAAAMNADNEFFRGIGRNFSYPGQNVSDDVEDEQSSLGKRTSTSSTSEYFNNLLVSLDPKTRFPRSGTRSFVYNYDSSAGAGQTVYTIGEYNIVGSIPELSGNPPREIPAQSKYGIQGIPGFYADHGTTVAAMVNGAQLGVAKSASVAYTQHSYPTDANLDVRDWYLESLLSAWDDMHANGRSPTSSIINMSFGAYYNFWVPAFIKSFYAILRMMDEAGVTILVAAGNQAETRPQIDTYPQLFAMQGNPLASSYQTSAAGDPGYLPNMIVVGSASRKGQQSPTSQTANFLSIYAAGYLIWGPTTSGGYDGTVTGTSFATPETAGLAAYFKGLNSQWQSQLNQASSSGPQAVKSLILAYGRVIMPATGQPSGLNLIWNGMSGATNCLTQYPNGGDPNDVCPDLPANIGGYTPPNGCDTLAKRDRDNATFFDTLGFGLFGRQAGGSCTLSGGAEPLTISQTQGPTAGPTCPSSCGGIVCTGYYCSPTPTGPPPGFQDPKDPSSGATVQPTTVTQGFGQPTSSPPAMTTSTPTKPTSTAPPEATCTINGQFSDELGYIWTNYITDGGAALEAAIKSECEQPNDMQVTNWQGYISTEQFTDDNKVPWEANNEWTFKIPLVEHPQALECVNRAIAAAGGSPNNPSCVFNPYLG